MTGSAAPAAHPDLRRSVQRGALVVLLCAAAVAHIPVIPDHLHEAPYMGVLFTAFTLACLALGAALVLTDDDRLLVMGAVLCGAGVLVYAATRLIAFPELDDDVGNWSEPLGVLAVVTEAAAAGLALRLRARRHRVTRRGAPPAAVRAGAAPAGRPRRADRPGPGPTRPSRPPLQPRGGRP